MEKRPQSPCSNPNRRDFLKGSIVAAVTGPAFLVEKSERQDEILVDDFNRPDGFYHGDGWESINPGYWMIQGSSLRRRLKHRGDQLPGRWFPWHWETHHGEPMPRQYDPSLPLGMIFRRDWKLLGNYTVRIEATIRSVPDYSRYSTGWKQHQAGYGLMGVAFGSHCLHESWTGAGRSGEAAWMAAWRDDGRFGIYDHATGAPERYAGRPEIEADLPKVRPDSEGKTSKLRAGERVQIEVAVTGTDREKAQVTARLIAQDFTSTVSLDEVNRKDFTDGYFGLAGQGLLDFEVSRLWLNPRKNSRLHTPLNELHVCYPLGNRLKKAEGRWRCRFIALFRNDGEQAEIRITDSPKPAGGWQSVPAAGMGKIVTNEFRRNTAVIDAILPRSPAHATLYYTVWKDGQDVTPDPRIGTDSVGPGTGFLGTVPSGGQYVGRLPRLKAPYRLCGLSCHAVVGNRPNLPRAEKYQEWHLHDQPTPEGYRHLEDFDFQIMVWEDDVWYLELNFPPPSVDDAYKVVTSTLAGPTTRWQMMRHWNVINPGDHDYGMDDVKGPEQIILRHREGLGQDTEYLRRNFEIVSHLITGDEAPSPWENPRRWHRWKMPDADFSLLMLDSRLWRSSQEVDIWESKGWGEKNGLYSRTDPTRALLGEEQFAWLQQTIQTDSSPLICLTGINALHTIWTGRQEDPETGLRWNQRDRVAADYAGWVKAGADRVLELLGKREGVVTVYGDVHNACILKNLEQRVYECSFGPIGRTGGRSVKPGFGRSMRDFDDRPLEVYALYHMEYGSPDLEPRSGPQYWNFLEMHFDPRGKDPHFVLRVRNLVDHPNETPRGGGLADDRASRTGRPHSCRLPHLTTLPNADVLFTTELGEPIRGARSLPDGSVPVRGLADFAADTVVLITAFDGKNTDVQAFKTLPV